MWNPFRRKQGGCACGHLLDEHATFGCYHPDENGQLYCPCTVPNFAQLPRAATSVARQRLEKRRVIPATGPAWSPVLVPVATEIVAWRAWNLVNNGKGWCLRSVSHDIEWTGPTLVANAIPNAQNGFGIYARPTREALDEYTQHPVIGEVALSGIVIEGTNGYRAERATIRSLWLDPAFAPPAPAFGMGVALCPLEAQTAILADLGARYQVAVNMSAAPHPPVTTFTQTAAAQLQMAAGLFNQHNQPAAMPASGMMSLLGIGSPQQVRIADDHYGVSTL